MTLHLTYVSGRCGAAVHTSDRLLTYQSEVIGAPPGVHDAFANKTVVLLAKRGLASIGYTGIAYIGSEPTDSWIARTLWQRELPPHGASYLSGSNRTRPRRSLGAYVEMLRSALEVEFRRLRQRERQLFGLCIGGFQWSPTGYPVVPILWGVVNSPGGLNEFVVQRWPSARWQHVSGLVVWPPHPTARAALAPELDECTSVDEIVAKLAGSIRTVATIEPTVGSDSLTVILRPRAPHVEVEFRPGVRTLIGVLDGPRGLVPLAFTPWVVSRNSLMSPMVLTAMDCGTQCDGYEVMMHGNPASPAGFSMPHGRMKRTGTGDPGEAIIQRIEQSRALLIHYSEIRPASEPEPREGS